MNMESNKPLDATQALITAARSADWMQVVLNQGPPCFYLEKERRIFCLRAERWAGHEDMHKFVSLASLLAHALRESQPRTLTGERLKAAAWKSGTILIGRDLAIACFDWDAIAAALNAETNAQGSLAAHDREIRLDEFELIVRERPADPTYWDMHHRRALQPAEGR
jgi:hypothetical protein